MINKTYKSIGEIAKELNLIDRKTGKTQTHTLRYWEKQFKQIKPSIKAGKRRYYTHKDFLVIKKIKNLLKNQGLTVNGVKKFLDNNPFDIDDNNKFIVQRSSFNKKKIQLKLKKIKEKINKLKEYKNG